MISVFYYLFHSWKKTATSTSQLLPQNQPWFNQTKKINRVFFQCRNNLVIFHILAIEEEGTQTIIHWKEDFDNSLQTECQKNFSRPLGLQGHKKWKSSTQPCTKMHFPARFPLLALKCNGGKVHLLPDKAPPTPLLPPFPPFWSPPSPLAHWAAH